MVLEREPGSSAPSQEQSSCYSFTAWLRGVGERSESPRAGSLACLGAVVVAASSGLRRFTAEMTMSDFARQRCGLPAQPAIRTSLLRDPPVLKLRTRHRRNPREGGDVAGCSRALRRRLPQAAKCPGAA